MAKGFQEDKEKAIADLNKKYEAINTKISFGLFVILILLIIAIIILKIIGGII
jgi:hypothetical protein